MRRFFIFLGMFAVCGILGPRTFGGTGTTRSSRETKSARGTGSAGKVPTFTLDQAILTALQQNPQLLNAEQEIKRTKGVIIQVRAQILPQVNANSNFQWTDPHLQGARIFGTTGTSGTTGTGTTPGGARSFIQAL